MLVEGLEGADEDAPVLQDAPHAVVDVLQHLAALAHRLRGEGGAVSGRRSGFPVGAPAEPGLTMVAASRLLPRPPRFPLPREPPTLGRFRRNRKESVTSGPAGLPPLSGRRARATPRFP